MFFAVKASPQSLVNPVLYMAFNADIQVEVRRSSVFSSPQSQSGPVLVGWWVIYMEREDFYRTGGWLARRREDKLYEDSRQLFAEQRGRPKGVEQQSRDPTKPPNISAGEERPNTNGCRSYRYLPTFLVGDITLFSACCIYNVLDLNAIKI